MINNFRKSKRSQGASNCVEVADSIMVRDSKATETVLTFSPDTWESFLVSLK